VEGANRSNSPLGELKSQAAKHEMALRSMSAAAHNNPPADSEQAVYQYRISHRSRRGKIVAHVRKLHHKLLAKLALSKKQVKSPVKNIASERIPIGENMLRFVILIDTALNLVLALSFAVMELQTFPPPHLPLTSQL
jgi:hypothetical protein